MPSPEGSRDHLPKCRDDQLRNGLRERASGPLRLVVETDSFAYHRGSVAFEDDHARDLDLRAAGFTVLRFSERQLEEKPGRVVADVTRALEQEDWC